MQLEHINQLVKQLPGMFNWFDCLVLVMVVLGAKVGRKYGLSMELGSCLQWLVILAAGASLYHPFGDKMAQFWLFSRLGCYIVAYIAAALVVKFAFSLLTKSTGGKLANAETFGWTEYYLGMVAGSVRFLCILLAGMALLNARLYTPQEVAANKSYQKDLYGAVLMPNISSLQKEVFSNSVCGKLVKKHLDCLLIQSTFPEKKRFYRKDDLP